MVTLESKIKNSIKIKDKSILLIPNVKNKIIDGIPYIKLYLKVCHACNESINHAWYPLEEILRLNANSIRPISYCNSERYNCGIDGIILSLKVRDRNNRYTRIDKLEIIYI